VILTNGALAKNIFWQIAGKVVVGGGAHLEGILLIMTDITFSTESSLSGRVLSQTACNLQVATITEPPSMPPSLNASDVPTGSSKPSSEPSSTPSSKPSA
jgi:hypothetical protein